MKEKRIGDFICGLREEHNLSQKQLADMLEVSDKAISKWEMNESNPKLEIMIKLSDLFDVAVEDIITCKYNLIHSNKVRSVLDKQGIALWLVLVVSSLLILVAFILNLFEVFAKPHLANQVFLFIVCGILSICLLCSLVRVIFFYLHEKRILIKEKKKKSIKQII